LGIMDKLKAAMGVQAKPETLEAALAKLQEQKVLIEEAVEEQARMQEALEAKPATMGDGQEVALFVLWLARRNSPSPALGKRNPASASLAANLTEMFLGSKRYKALDPKELQAAFDKLKPSLPDME
jgi:hypothetical protein